MKTIILASLSALTLFAVTACDGGGGAGPESSAESEQPAMTTTPAPETGTDTAQ